MLEFKQLSAQQEADWNAYVAAHPQATAYHALGWKLAIEQAYGHRTAYWMAYQQERCVAVLPLALLSKPFAGTEAVSLPFCDAGQCLADSAETEQALLEYVAQQLAQQGIKQLDYRQADALAEQDLDKDSLAQAKVRMLLALPEDSAALLASFKSKLRSQVNKAKKNGLHAECGKSAKYLGDFYQVFSKNMRDLGSPVHSKAWFEAVLKHYGEQACLVVIYKEEIPVGAGITLTQAGQTSIPWASTNAEYNRLAPNMLLYWELMARATDGGAKVFDFGRSTYGEGTYKFKSQWGAKPARLKWSEIACPSGQISEKHNTGEVGKLRSTVEQVWKKLPVGLCNQLGPRVRKYISL